MYMHYIYYLLVIGTNIVIMVYIKLAVKVLLQNSGRLKIEIYFSFISRIVFSSLTDRTEPEPT